MNERRRGSRLVLLVVSLAPALLGIRPAIAPPPALPARLDLAVDLDDDDENGVADALDPDPPMDDLGALALSAPTGSARVSFTGALRVFVGRHPLVSGTVIRTSGGILLRVQSTREGDASITVVPGNGPAHTTRVVSHAITFETAQGDLDTRSNALLPSAAVPNDLAFLRGDLTDDAFRVRVRGGDSPERLSLRRIRGGDPHRAEHGVLTAPLSEGRSPALRLVSAEVDAEAPLVNARLLLVGLRDRVDAELPTATGTVRQSLRVGRPPVESGPDAARVATVVVHPTAVAHPELERVVERQVALANEIFAPCAIAFVSRIVRAPVAPARALVSFGDEDGLPASGGHLRARLGDHELPALPTRAGEDPVSVARRFAELTREAGFSPALHLFARSDRANAAGADVLVRDAAGALVDVALVEASDARLRVTTTRVDLDDGLLEFDDATAGVGTREERALVLAGRDSDEATLDVFLVPRFTRGARVGEAFVPREAGPLAGAVILDARALALTELAFTLAHEVAHVLLDSPFHARDFGRDARTALLGSGTARGDLRAARRLTREDCTRMRAAGGRFLAAREP